MDDKILNDDEVIQHDLSLFLSLPPSLSFSLFLFLSLSLSLSLRLYRCLFFFYSLWNLFQNILWTSFLFSSLLFSSSFTLSFPPLPSSFVTSRILFFHYLFIYAMFQDEDDDDGDEGFGLDTVTESMMIAKMQVRHIIEHSLLSTIKNVL